MWSKTKDSLLILLICIISPPILEMFRFPVLTRHKIGLLLIGLAAAGFIFSKKNDEADVIAKVFEVKGVAVDDLVPLLIGGTKDDREESL